MFRSKHMFILLFLGSLLLSAVCSAQADDSTARLCKVKNDARKTYLLVGKLDARASKPRGLVIIMPGGSGSADFHPFCKRIHQYALGDSYLAAVPVAVKWTPGQRIVWPKKSDRVRGAKFTTEQFVKEIIAEVGGKFKIDARRIFTLSWSSSGPAAYAVSFQKETAVTGSYIAMSVFNPVTPGWNRYARNHAYFIDHSPQDKTCPYWMAQKAEKLLKTAGARVKLNTYEGGHGWHGNVFGRMRTGIAWLEKQAEQKKQSRQKKK